MLRKLKVPPPPLAGTEMTSVSVSASVISVPGSILTAVLPVITTKWWCTPLIKSHPAASSEPQEARNLGHVLTHGSPFVTDPPSSDKIVCNVLITDAGDNSGCIMKPWGENASLSFSYCVKIQETNRTQDFISIVLQVCMYHNVCVVSSALILAKHEMWV